jgi:hypothetical protein
MPLLMAVFLVECALESIAIRLSFWRGEGLRLQRLNAIDAPFLLIKLMIGALLMLTNVLTIDL